MTLSKLFGHIDNQKDSVIHWQREMTARPSMGPENGGVGELEKAVWLEQELSRIGLTDIRRVDSPDPRVPCGFRPNIVAVLPGKSPRTLWMIGHMDVVPPGDESLWNDSPYSLRVEDDLVYGRGVEDNQQAIVTSMLAAQALIAEGIVPELSLGMLFVADEETGMTHGLPHILAAEPQLIGPDDLVLVSDMGNHEGSMVEIAEKSCLWLQITITGKQCHASTPDKGINSLIVASACVMELESLYRIFREKDPLYSPAWSTFVPSKKEANVENVNTLPGKDVFFLDCRVLPQYDIEDVTEKVREIVTAVASRYGATAEVAIVNREQAPQPTSTDAPVVRSLVKALQEHRGIQARICGVGGQTVSACLRKEGIPAVVWGTLMPNAHVPNECSRISATLADAKILLAMLFDSNW